MEELLKKIEDYLESKIPEIPKSTRYEIASFLVYNFAIHENDAIAKNNREWKRTIYDRQEKRDIADLRERIDKMRREKFAESEMKKVRDAVCRNGGNDDHL